MWSLTRMALWSYRTRPVPIENEPSTEVLSLLATFWDGRTDVTASSALPLLEYALARAGECDE